MGFFSKSCIFSTKTSTESKSVFQNVNPGGYLVSKANCLVLSGSDALTYKFKINHSLPYLMLHVNPINFNFNSCNFVKKVKYMILI